MEQINALIESIKSKLLSMIQNKPIPPPDYVPQEIPNDPSNPLIPYLPYQVVLSSEKGGDYPPEEKIKLVAIARAICKKEGLSDQLTLEMLCTICGESGWNPNAVNRNYRNGIVMSTDYGLCMINDYYHFRELGLTPYSAIHDVVKVLTYMADTFKVHPDYWVAHQNANWKKHINQIPK